MKLPYFITNIKSTEATPAHITFNDINNKYCFRTNEYKAGVVRGLHHVAKMLLNKATSCDKDAAELRYLM